MEQKKTLWIVVAVGVFLLVVLGAAVVISATASKQDCSMQTYYNPADGFVTSPKANMQPNGVKPVQPVNIAEVPAAEESSEIAVPPQGVPPLPPQGVAPVSPVKVENVTVITDNALVYGTGTTTTIDLNNLKSNPASSAVVTPQNSLTANQMNQTQQAAPVQQYTPAPDSYYAPAPKAAKPAPKKEAAPAKAAPAKTASKPAAKPAKAAKTASKTSAKASKPAAPSSFWIQVGSYEAKKSADEARSILESNKIPNEVFTYKDAKGKLFYRVRVGPYTTKSEAEYWQKRISTINEFVKTNSYVVKN